MNSHLYFISILLPAELEKKIKAIKNNFAEEFKSKMALQLPGHITLQIPFRIGTKLEDFLLES
jgi:2'-5' RNA ligase